MPFNITLLRLSHSRPLHAHLNLDLKSQLIKNLHEASNRPIAKKLPLQKDAPNTIYRIVATLQVGLGHSLYHKFALVFNFKNPRNFPSLHAWATSEPNAHGMGIAHRGDNFDAYEPNTLPGTVSLALALLG
ncbi:hypothetical protein DSO57_1024890 [Entomophthora muscae]|uniref:Uncharacterized protein n=1 Tax=Entomophthora muscae TaxID=34485 RepID=A0ACC2TPS2_9FUNG|nr:hypothetical protein DSO57_1024890 [Entomophthora muscae]